MVNVGFFLEMVMGGEEFGLFFYWQMDLCNSTFSPSPIPLSPTLYSYRLGEYSYFGVCRNLMPLTQARPSLISVSNGRDAI